METGSSFSLVGPQKGCRFERERTNGLLPLSSDLERIAVDPLALVDWPGDPASWAQSSSEALGLGISSWEGMAKSSWRPIARDMDRADRKSREFGRTRLFKRQSIGFGVPPRADLAREKTGRSPKKVKAWRFVLSNGPAECPCCHGIDSPESGDARRGEEHCESRWGR